MSEFVDYYNHHHRHAGIGLHTPADVHYGLAPATAQQRSQTLAAARLRHPTRFATTHDPKILELPAAAWINQPKDQEHRGLKSLPLASSSLDNFYIANRELIKPQKN